MGCVVIGDLDPSPHLPLVVKEVKFAVEGSWINLDPFRSQGYAALETGTRTDATQGGGTNADSNSDVLLAADRITPGGLIFERVPAPDALDPQRLNGPIPLEEQQKIAGAPITKPSMRHLFPTLRGITFLLIGRNC